MAQNDNATPEMMTTSDGTPLKESLRRSMRRNKLKALLLVAPLGLFIFFSFVMPILTMMYRSLTNPEVIEQLPRATEQLRAWSHADSEIPPEAFFQALALDMMTADEEDRSIGRAGGQLNYELPGARSMFGRTGRSVTGLDEQPESWRDFIMEQHRLWEDPTTYRTMQRQMNPITAQYYLNAVDMRYTPDGSIERQPEFQRVYVELYWRTFWVSALITALTILLGFPVAYLLANLPMRISNLLMILVLLPFWTSLLVRTSSWIVILQSQGVLNDVLVLLGIIADDNRPRLIYNMIGTVVGMTHILLPFMILPLYSVMKTIPPSYMRAARSLGANPVVAFVRVYVPQTVAGVGAGSILVFILSIGYYITPALIGGSSGQLISNFIAYHMQQSLNWSLAAALGGILLVAVLILYYFYNKLIGVDKMKLG
jgi:putative spermidine/putrescine transport system permease protein